jgi:DNA-binding Lrp family transcriptional regulator
MTEPDPVDQALIAELQKNGRASVVELAKKLRQPRTTIVGRLHRLEASKIILGYSVRLDHRKLGNPVRAFLMVAFTPDAGTDQRQLARRIAGLPGVEEVTIISGEWDILVQLRGASLEAIGDLVLDRIRREPGVARTMTFAAFATIKE